MMSKMKLYSRDRRFHMYDILHRPGIEFLDVYARSFVLWYAAFRRSPEMTLRLRASNRLSSMQPLPVLFNYPEHKYLPSSFQRHGKTHFARKQNWGDSYSSTTVRRRLHYLCINLSCAPRIAYENLLTADTNKECHFERYWDEKQQTRKKSYSNR